MKKRDDAVSRSMAGSGCAGDPPAFPTYFYGIETGLSRPSRDRGSMSLTSAAEHDWISAETKRQAADLIAQWYASGRLPEDHPRVQLWQKSQYQHFAHCYYRPTEPDEYKRPNSRLLVIYPVPSYELSTFRDDPRFSDEWRTLERAAIEQKNREIIEATALVATPDNHAAVVLIRRFYPEHVARLDWIADPPKMWQQDWWETCEQRPQTDEECRSTCRHGIRTDHTAVDAGSWCRWCGYGLPEYAAELERAS